MAQDDEHLVAASLRVAAVAAACCVIAGILVMAGWVWQVEALLAPGASRERVSPDTALAIISLGLALWYERTGPPSRRRRGLAVASMALLATLNLLKQVAHLDLGVTPLLFRSVGAPDMAPNTAIALFVLAMALQLIDRPARRLVSVSEALSLIAGAIGAFVFIGYLYGTDVLLGPPQYTVVALPTSILLIVAAVGVHAVRPRTGWMTTLLSSHAGGLLLRRLLAPVMLLPPIVGYIALVGQRAGLFDTAFGYALVACVDVIVITWLLIATARQLNLAEAGRLTERDLRQKLEQLGEATVAISGAILQSRQVGMSQSMEIQADVDVTTIMQAIVDQGRRVTGAGIGALGIGTDPAVPFCPWVFSGIDPDTPGRIGRYPRPVGTLGLVAREGLSVRTPDVSAHEAFRGWPAGHTPVTSLLAVPIRFEGRNVGNLYLGNKVGAKEFSLNDQRAVELLVSHAAVALRQAQMRAVISTQRAHIETVLAAAPNGIMFVDAHTGNLAANAMATQLFGLALDPILGHQQYLSMARYPDGRPISLADLPSTRALAGETVLAEEGIIVRPDGRQVAILASASPIRGAEGAIEGAVVILQDISKRKALERARDEYLSLISHDLRGPLTVIALQATSLCHSHDPAVRTRAAGIQDNVRRLTTMIADLVESSRLESGQMDLRPVRTELMTVADRLLRTGLSDDERRHVIVELPEGLPPLSLDPPRIERVLVNLVRNAAKYAGPDWQVTVAARVVDGAAEISVADRGPGFPQQDLPHLFAKYYRGRRPDTVEGLGLGLYICRLIVEAHGGHIWAENRPGGGAVIRFRLPIREAGTRSAA